MEKKDLIELLNELLLPIGFKRKGNNWVINSDEVNKIINLQKSQYSDSYYLNYSYIINSLPLKGFRDHVSNRLGSTDNSEQKKITDLLNLENDISFSKRREELIVLVKEQIISTMETVKNEEGIFRILKNMKFRYTVPPHVLEYFNLPVEDK